jgi:hypothetical protein
MNRPSLAVGMAGNPDGRLPDVVPGLVDVKSCNQLLHQNLAGLSLPER